MATIPPIPPGICFGPFELDLAAGELRKGGILVKLQPQPFQVLRGRVFGPVDIPEILLCFAPLALGFNYCGTTSIPVTVAYPSTGTKLSSSLP